MDDHDFLFTTSDVLCFSFLSSLLTLIVFFWVFDLPINQLPSRFNAVIIEQSN